MRLRVVDAALEAGLTGERRELLFEGIDLRYFRGLRVCGDPRTQLQSDLATLNRARLFDGSWPLERWLTNAVALARPHAATETFSAALAETHRQLQTISLRRDAGIAVWYPTGSRALPIVATGIGLVACGLGLVSLLGQMGAGPPGPGAPASEARQAPLEGEAVAPQIGAAGGAVRVLHHASSEMVGTRMHPESFVLDEPAVLFVSASATTLYEANSVPSIIITLSIDGKPCGTDRDYSTYTGSIEVRAGASCVRYLDEGKHDVRVQLARASHPNKAPREVTLLYNAVAIAATAD